MKSRKQVRLKTNPKYRGIDIQDYDYLDKLPTVTLDLNKDKFEFWEKNKLNTPHFKEQVQKMIKYIKDGSFIPPPIAVIETGFFSKKYLVIDGHHRFEAYKQLGISKIPAKIVPKKDVEKFSGIPTLYEQQKINN